MPTHLPTNSGALVRIGGADLGNGYCAQYVQDLSVRTPQNTIAATVPPAIGSGTTSDFTLAYNSSGMLTSAGGYIDCNNVNALVASVEVVAGGNIAGGTYSAASASNTWQVAWQWSDDGINWFDDVVQSSAAPAVATLVRQDYTTHSSGLKTDSLRVITPLAQYGRPVLKNVTNNGSPTSGSVTIRVRTRKK